MRRVIGSNEGSSLKVVKALTVSALLVGVAASCAAGSEAPALPSVTPSSSSPDTSTSSEAAIEPSETPEALLPMESFSHTVDSDGGFSQTMTITMGPVVPASEPTVLDAQWAAVGGLGTYPCSDTDFGPGNPDAAGFAFGTMEIVNNTPGFTAANKIYQFWRNEPSALGLAYTNGPSCDLLDRGGMLFSPSEFDNVWGPVPIVVAIDNYRTPAFPNGDAALLDRNGLALHSSDFFVPLVPWTP